VSQFKYLFPVAVFKKSQLEVITGRKDLPDVPYFEVIVPSKFNPLLISKDEPELAKKWEEEGVKVELI